jgi:hypothetical protein
VSHGNEFGQEFPEFFRHHFVTALIAGAGGNLDNALRLRRDGNEFNFHGGRFYHREENRDRKLEDLQIEMYELGYSLAIGSNPTRQVSTPWKEQS